MRNYRFSILSHAADQVDSKSEKILVRNPELIHQIKNVLRLSPGHEEEISFINGVDRFYYTAELQSLNKDSAEFRIIALKNAEREPETNIHFLLPIIKIEAFEFMLRKLCELGVSKFTPVIFSRSQKSTVQKISSNKSQARFEKIIQEAIEQCEGCIFPQLEAPISFHEIETHINQKTQKFFASERLALRAAPSVTETSAELTLLCGPEGGLTDEEVNFLDQNGFIALSLGKRLLKAETAAIALSCRLLG